RPTSISSLGCRSLRRIDAINMKQAVMIYTRSQPRSGTAQPRHPTPLEIIQCDAIEITIEHPERVLLTCVIRPASLVLAIARSHVVDANVTLEVGAYDESIQVRTWGSIAILLVEVAAQRIYGVAVAHMIFGGDRTSVQAQHPKQKLSPMV